MTVKSEYKNKIQLFVGLSDLLAKRPQIIRRLDSGLLSASTCARDYSNDGVRINNLAVTQPQSVRAFKIGVIASNWPTWAFGFHHTRFHLVWIVVHEHAIAQLCKRFFKQATVLLMSSLSWESLQAVDVVCFSGKELGAISAPPMGSIVLCDWNCRPTKAWKDWTSKFIQGTHSMCGGVTNHAFTFRLFVHKHTLASFSLENLTVDPHPRTTVNCIVSCTIGGKALPQPPSLHKVNSSEVHSLGKNLFHYKGLYPIDCFPRAEFFLPCVFTPSKWVQRTLKLQKNVALSLN